MSSPIRLSSPITPFIIRLMDILLIWLAGYLALKLRKGIQVPDVLFPENLTGYHSLIAGAGFVFLVFSQEVYRSWRGSALPLMLIRVAAAWLAVIGVLLLWLFFVKASDDYSRIWFGLWAVLGITLLWAERLGVYLMLRILRRKGYNLKHVALVGQGPTADRLLKRLTEIDWTGFHIAHQLPDPNGQQLEQLAREPLDEIWLALPLSDADAIRKTLHGLRHTVASIRLSPDWFTYRLINHGVSDVLGIPMLDLTASPMIGLNPSIKWLEDKTLSAVFLLLVSPLMLLLALGVKLSSPGPVFYRQERAGLNNQPFMMLKFRSMPLHAEAGGVRWGGSEKKTTTRFGRFIRRTSLDELPQFINVLKGDMSIVGPRPERPMFVEQFKHEVPDYMKKHMVKAGITGWAQVNGWRGDTDLHARIEHDLYYIENWSLWLDLKVIALTVVKGFFNKNAY
jgi:putative colanic acid biosysnthesis UDP-glucose lipid carrier transferase